MHIPLTSDYLVAIAIVVTAVTGAARVVRGAVVRTHRRLPWEPGRPREPLMDVEVLDADQLRVAKLVKEPEIQILVPVRERLGDPVRAGRLAALELDPADQGVRGEVAERLRDVVTLVRPGPAGPEPDVEIRCRRRPDRFD
jgi:hypothetical protein